MWLQGTLSFTDWSMLVKATVFMGLEMCQSCCVLKLAPAMGV